MNAHDLRTTTNPPEIANDNVGADVRLWRLLAGIGVYIVAAVFGWCAVGIAVALWIFEP